MKVMVERGRHPDRHSCTVSDGNRITHDRPVGPFVSA